MPDTMRHAEQHSSPITPALVSALNYVQILATTARFPKSGSKNNVQTNTWKQTSVCFNLALTIPIAEYLLQTQKQSL
jgi:hypothetical protein